MNDHFSRILEGWVSIALPLIFFLLRNRRKAKEEQDKRHEENQKLLREIQTSHRFLPPHLHTERQGTLSAEGIRYEPDKR